MVTYKNHSANAVMAFIPPGQKREMMMAGRAIAGVVDSPFGVIESIPQSTNPSFTARDYITAWGRQYGIEASVVTEAMEDAEKMVQQVRDPLSFDSAHDCLMCVWPCGHNTDKVAWRIVSKGL